MFVAMRLHIVFVYIVEIFLIPLFILHATSLFLQNTAQDLFKAV